MASIITITFNPCIDVNVTVPSLTGKCQVVVVSLGSARAMGLLPP